MIVGKNLDSTIIGKSYLSYLFGLSHLSVGNSTLIIDDSRVKHGETWTGFFGEIEKSFLKHWGKVLGIGILENIEKYLTPCPIHLYLGNKRVYLGGDPFSNFKELARNFHDFFGVESLLNFNFDKEIFDQSFISFANRVAEVSLKFKNFQTINGAVFKEVNCPEFNLIFDLFSKRYHNLDMAGENIDQRQFVMLCRSFLQGKISDSLTDFELGHLLTSLLTPYYKLDKKRFSTDLKKLFRNKYGGIKSTTIQSWEIYKGILKYLQVSSFEGVIRPGHTYYLGEPHFDMPFKVYNNDEVFGCLEISVMKEYSFRKFVGHRILFTDHEHLGTQLPIIDIMTVSEHEINVRFPYPLLPGSKPDFYYSKGLKILHEFCEEKLGVDIKRREFNISMRDSADTWTRPVSGERLFSKSNVPGHRYRGLKISLGPDEEQSVKGLEYWGILNSYPLGLLSMLMEMNEKTRQRGQDFQRNK